jgi:hypothetical protein
VTAPAPLGPLQRALGRLGAAVIRLWLRLFGRTVSRRSVPWLDGPVGPAGEIGDRPYELVPAREGLTIDRDGGLAGLVPDFAALEGPDFPIAAVDPEVRRFYEQTSRYQLDVWSESPFPGRLFLWLIVYTVSRYMNQLNFPVFGLELSRGMTSEVLPLRDAAGRIVHTGWYRRTVESGRVVYTGFYTTVIPPGHPSACVKVVFPLPRGNATVLLAPGVDAQGRFTLTSSGRRFGEAGFYRTLALDGDRLKVRRLQSLREFFTVYRDAGGELRCDHRVTFLGLTMLRLHYRMRPRDAGATAAANRLV